MGQKYYDFSQIFGEEMEALLVQLKNLIKTKKVTDNLPDNVNNEFKKINDKVDNITIEGDIDYIDGGNYTSE